MINYNLHDWARQNKEDPINFINNQLQIQKQKLILRHSFLPNEIRYLQGNESQLHQLVHSDDDEEEKLQQEEEG